jgi:hypothetical protein
MVQHGKEICKVPVDWAVANGAALFGGRLMEGRRLKVVSGEVWADWWSMDLRWKDRAFSHLFRSGLHHFVLDFFFL